MNDRNSSFTSIVSAVAFTVGLKPVICDVIKGTGTSFPGSLDILFICLLLKQLVKQGHYIGRQNKN